MRRLCNLCGQPIVLVPSAAERAKKYGDMTAAEYAALFPTHTTCFLKKRKLDTEDLMRRLK